MENWRQIDQWKWAMDTGCLPSIKKKIKMEISGACSGGMGKKWGEVVRFFLEGRERVQCSVKNSEEGLVPFWALQGVWSKMVHFRAASGRLYRRAAWTKAF